MDSYLNKLQEVFGETLEERTERKKQEAYEAEHGTKEEQQEWRENKKKKKKKPDMTEIDAALNTDRIMLEMLYNKTGRFEKLKIKTGKNYEVFKTVNARSDMDTIKAIYILVAEDQFPNWNKVVLYEKDGEIFKAIKNIILKDVMNAEEELAKWEEYQEYMSPAAQKQRREDAKEKKKEKKEKSKKGPQGKGKSRPGTVKEKTPGAKPVIDIKKPKLKSPEKLPHFFVGGSPKGKQFKISKADGKGGESSIWLDKQFIEPAIIDMIGPIDYTAGKIIPLEDAAKVAGLKLFLEKKPIMIGRMDNPALPGGYEVRLGFPGTKFGAKVISPNLLENLKKGLSMGGINFDKHGQKVEINTTMPQLYPRMVAFMQRLGAFKK